MRTSNLFLYVLALLALLYSCGASKEVSKTANDSMQPLCGIYTGPNSLVDTLDFISWNRVGVMTEFIPPSHYFTSQDTLVVLPDKSYFMFRMSSDRSQLYGLGGWVGTDTMHLVPGTNSNCPTYQLKAEEAHWINLEKRYHETVLSGTLGQQFVLSKQLCEEGHAKSCINYAFARFLKQETPMVDTNLLIRAGELGDYMGYFRLGETLETLETKEQKQRAKFYYDKACTMGHQASCMMSGFMDIGEE